MPILMPLVVRTLGEAFISEFAGTGILMLLGVGVVANALLGKTKGNAGGQLFINWGWGIAVMAGVYFATPTGGHLNPAVTLGVVARELILGHPVDWTLVAVYIVAQLLGAMLGAFLAWLAYKQHYDEDLDPALKLATFSTGPAIRSYGWNFATEAIATFVLVGWVVVAGLQDPNGYAFAPIGVTLLIVGIGASLGGPTGYAINPARDLGPRIVHALLPIKGKGGSDWSYSWVPVLGPLVGGILAGVIVTLVYRASGFLTPDAPVFYQLAAK